MGAGVITGMMIMAAVSAVGEVVCTSVGKMEVATFMRGTTVASAAGTFIAGVIALGSKVKQIGG